MNFRLPVLRPTLPEDASHSPTYAAVPSWAAASTAEAGCDFGHRDGRGDDAGGAAAERVGDIPADSDVLTGADHPDDLDVDPAGGVNVRPHLGIGARAGLLAGFAMATVAGGIASLGTTVSAPPTPF